MTLNQRLFIIVPLVSMLLNLFLFLAVLSAKKTRLIYAFMGLLAGFMAWCTGSLFMRMTLYPGPGFWYQVSIIGIFAVPYLIYNFIYFFTDQKGTFVRGALAVSWVILDGLNLFNIYIPNPQVIEVAGERRFEYEISPLIVLPILVAVFTLFLAWRMAYRSVKEDRVPFSQFQPMIVGVVIMFIGTVAAVLPQMVSLPNDTFSCGVNALCLYYALYKKRLVQLRSFASNGTTYLVSAVFTTLLLVVSYEWVDDFYTAHFAEYLPYKTIVFAVGFSVLTMAAFNLVRALMSNLFVKRQEAQEAQLKQFSDAVNKTLKLEEVLEIYRNYLQQTMPGYTARVFLYTPETGDYRLKDCTKITLQRGDTISPDNPLIGWLKRYRQGISWQDFQRTRTCRAMWDKERQYFVRTQVNFILPIVCDNELTAITLFSDEIGTERPRPMELRQINFLESLSAVLSMALKNASLYAAIEFKAQRDALTNLYNRNYFEEQIRRDFENCRHADLALLMISFDDFHLYNELYGTQEGDRILRLFGEKLAGLVGSRGTVARYGGKEFAASLPFCTAQIAQNCAQQAREWLQQQLAASAERTQKFLTFSAGICSYPLSAASVEELFTYANMAVYSAKTSGKNRIVQYMAQSEQDKANQNLTEKKALAENCAGTIYALTAAIDAKDHYTFNHSNNVAEYAAALAAAIPLDAEHVEIIRQAGLLHDIGKIGIPEAILSKKDALTDEEYEIMKQHVEGSIAMIRYLPSLDYVIPSAIGHHERWDGKGYPRGIAGEAIPIGARCLCIADSFDAMVTRRSYKSAMSVGDALQEIRRNLGTQFDPQLGQLFIQLVEGGKIIPHTEK